MADETSKPRLSRATAQPASRSSGDPLAELARLIGRDEVFQQMRDEATRAKPAAPTSERAPAAWLARPRDPRQDLRGAQAAAEERPAEPRSQATPIRPGLLPGVRPQAEARPAPARPTVPAQPEPAAYDHGYDAPATQPAYEPEPAYDAFEDRGARSSEPAAAHEAYQETYEDQAYYEDDPAFDAEDMPPRRRRTGMWAFAAVLSVAVVGVAGAFGYRAITGSSSESQAPIIKADTAPAKLVPPAPAKDPQSRTASLDRNPRGQPERLVSNEEQPVDLDAKLAAARGNAASATTGAIGPTVSQPSMMSLASAPPAAAPADAGAPKKVRTISIRPDGTMASPPPAAGRMANATDAGARPPGDMAGRPAASRAPAPQQGASPATDATRPTRSASLGAPTPTQTAPVAAPVMGPMVQLASQKSEADAQTAYRALQAKYPKILSGRQATIKRVEIADKGTFYRAQVGPFASTDQASEFCNSLKAVGGQCIVQRN